MIDIIEQLKETTVVKPSAILKALTVYNQALDFVRPLLKYNGVVESEKALEKLVDMLQHQNTFEYLSEDNDYVDIRWSEGNTETGDLDEVIMSLQIHTYMPDTPELDTLTQFDIGKAKHYVSFSPWVTIGITGEDYPLEYDLEDLVYTVEKHYNLLDK